MPHSIRKASLFGRWRGATPAVLCLTTLILSGCATNKNDLIVSGHVSIELEPAGRGFYRDIHAYAENGGLRVVGFVRRSLAPGTLNVQLLTPERDSVVEERVRITQPPRSSRVRHARFEAQLSAIPERGAVIRIVHNAGAN